MTMRALSVIACIALALAACNDDDAKTPTAAPTAAPTALAAPDRNARDRGRAMQAAAAACEPSPDRNDRAACARGCELGHSNSCARLGHILEEAGDEALALERYRIACRGGSGVGCEGQSRLSGDEALLRDARGYHRVHCEQGYARSCFDLAKLMTEGLGGPADAATAETYRARACHLGWTTGCATDSEP